jgi:diguanylate cyclase (GGDEF)-like protein
MNAPLQRRLRYLLWPPPEPELADAGRAGEIVIARARLVLIALLALTGLATLVREPGALSGRLGVGVALVLCAAGVAILHYARAGTRGQTLATVSTLLDVSVVSAYHLLLFVGGDSETALGSRVSFALYILAIAGATLRYDGRVVRLAGIAAALQYLAIVAWANATGRAATAGGRFYGDATVAGQVEEVIVLAAATTLGALLVERARELRLSGIRDPLTRLANRSFFQDRLEQELRRAARSGQPAALAILDIDHFKHVNDTHGHAAGDLVLRRVASALRRAMRRSDLVARLGGEEFAILLPETPLAAARAKIDSLRTTLGASAIEIGGGRAVRVTVSAGLAACPDDGTEGPRLLEVADSRLLAGKRAGRDVVVAAG